MKLKKIGIYVAAVLVIFIMWLILDSVFPGNEILVICSVLGCAKVCHLIALRNKRNEALAIFTGLIFNVAGVIAYLIYIRTTSGSKENST